MTDHLETTTQRRRLAALLRELRVAAGLSQTALGQRMEVSQSTVSNLETGSQVPTAASVKAWARACGAAAAVVEDLVERAEAVQTEAATFREVLRQGIAAKQQRIGQVEERVSTIRLFQPACVPGLLQTAEYARRLIASGGHTTPGQTRDVAAAVTARLDRQSVLYDETKRIVLLTTEAALRFRPGRDSALVVADQLDRVASLSTLRTVRIGVIPLDVEGDAVHMHGFCIFGDPAIDEQVFVSVETFTSELTVRDPRDVAAYLEEFELLLQTAVFDSDARSLLSKLAAHLRGL